VKEGVLSVAQRAPRLLLDVRSVHEVSHIIRDLRALGRDRDLLDEVWRRLGDAALLERPDLRESIEQPRRARARCCVRCPGMAPQAATVAWRAHRGPGHPEQVGDSSTSAVSQASR
jgi:hypothetical protein